MPSRLLSGLSSCSHEGTAERGTGAVAFYHSAPLRSLMAAWADKQKELLVTVCGVERLGSTYRASLSWLTEGPSKRATAEMPSSSNSDS